VDVYTWDSLVLPFQKYPRVLWVKFSPKIPIIYQLASIEDFEENNTRVVNSLAAIETCDKMSSYLLWQRNFQNDFKMPTSLITRDIGVAIDFISAHSSIFKPINLGLGQGIFQLEKDTQLEKKLRKLVKRYGVLFLQEYIANLGYDIRAIVMAGRNIIEYARQNPDDFRYNVHLGGEIQALNQKETVSENLIDRIRKIAVKIAEKTGLDMVGIDFLLSQELELYVIEWNAFFNFQGVESALKVNIAKQIALLLDKLAAQQ
jgi:RimK family alpha-L-glutamate ligase